MYWKVAILLGLSAALSAIEYFLYLQRRKLKELERLRGLEKVIFFDDSLDTCRDHLISGNSCGETCSHNKVSYLVARLNDCKSTIDLCMFLMTCHNLSSALAAAVERGVRVRMLYDYDMAVALGTMAVRSSGCSAMVWRCGRNPHARHMHHKFVVLDKQLVVTGSANWTLQAFCGNWENVVVSADPQLVHQLSETFHELWETFALVETLPLPVTVALHEEQ